MKFFCYLLAAALLALPVTAAPMLSATTTVFGGRVVGSNFVTGTVGVAANANNWSAAQSPTRLVNGIMGGDSEKYLNSAITNTAVIFTSPVARPVSRMELWVANDSLKRDPASYQLYGTNAAIPSLNGGDNVALTSFTLLGSGNLALPDARDTTANATGLSQILAIPNTTAYASYLLVFPTVKGPSPDAMQLSEVQLYDSGVIGLEQFDYEDGSIAGKSEGTFWNYKNTSPAGQIGFSSTWEPVAGTPVVSSGQLVTDNSAARRKYYGGALEADGAINPIGTTPLSVAKSVYYRVSVTTGQTLPDYFGVSSFDFGAERLFFGKRFGSPNFGLEISGDTAANTPFVIGTSTRTTLVAKLDFASHCISLFVNPDFAAAEPAPAATLLYLGTNWSTAVRLASGSGGAVSWDDLVVATSWADLGTVVTTPADDDDGNLGGSSGVSLREAVKYAPAGSLVEFGPNFIDPIITLTRGEMIIPQALTLDATQFSTVSDYDSGLSINAAVSSRHFQVPAGRSLTLRSLTLARGTTPGEGGAVYSEGTLRLVRCVLKDNVSANSGGGVTAKGGFFSAVDTMFFDNKARDYSGGLHPASATCTMARCTFSGNVANDGGAIFQTNNSTVTMSDCTIVGNRSLGAPSTGGIAVFQGNLALRHCSITQNTGNGGSGGLYLQDPAAITLQSCILAGNVDGGGGNPDLSKGGGSLFVGDSNLIGNNAGLEDKFPTGPLAGTAVAPLDPKLAPLGEYGGSTWTMPPMAGSPAIDAATTSTEPLDQRGISRPVDGDGNGTAIRDLGAVEAPPALMVTTLADQFDVPIGPEVSLREAIAYSSPGATIRFGPAFNGNVTHVITLNPGSGEIEFEKGLIVDAVAVSGGVTVNGGGTGRIFVFQPHSGAFLRRLNFTNGGGAGNLNSGYGGAIHGLRATITMADCAFSGNHSSIGGGAIQHFEGALVLDRCLFTGNSSNDGGAVYSSASDARTPKVSFMQMTNCTLTGNTATHDGGACLNLDGRSTLLHCTITGNTAPNGHGSGVRINEVTNVTTVQNCIITANSLANDVATYQILANSFVSLGGNVIGGGDGKSAFTKTRDFINQTAANANLSTLAPFGGPTFTMALRPGSRALGNATASPVTIDQRGFPTVGAKDSGAYEAGTRTSYNPWIFETLPATATPEQMNPTADYDGDGAPNESEFIAGTAAENPGSVLRPTLTRAGANLLISFPSVSGRTYQLQTTSNVATGGWTNTAHPTLTGDGSVKTFTVVNPAGPRAFYRVRVAN